MKASNEISYIANKRNELTFDYNKEKESNHSRLSLRKKKINSFFDNYKEKDYQKQFEERKFTNDRADEIIIPEIYIQKENSISTKEKFLEYILDLLLTKDVSLIIYAISTLKKNFSFNIYDILDENLTKQTDFVNKFFGILSELNSNYYVLSEGFHILNHILEILKAEFINENVNTLLIYQFDLFIVNHRQFNNDLLILIMENLKILFSKKLDAFNKKNNSNTKSNINQDFDSALDTIFCIIESSAMDSRIYKISLELIFEILKYLNEQGIIKEETIKLYGLSQNSLIKLQHLLIFIFNNCVDLNITRLIMSICLFLSEKEYCEENSQQLNNLMESNFLISFIERKEQEIHFIKIESSEKNISEDLSSFQESLIDYFKLLQNIVNTKEIKGCEQLKIKLISLIQGLFGLQEISETLEKEMIILLSKLVLIDRKFITLLIENKEASNLLKKNFISKYNRILRIEYLYFFRNLFYNCSFNLASKITNSEFLTHLSHLMKNVQDPIFIDLYLDALGYLFNIEIKNNHKNFELNNLNVKNYHENFVEHFPVYLNRNPFRKIFANLDGIELLESLQTKYSGNILKRINNLLEILELENDPKN